jgi:post-GPI attachment to proteins factor 3
VYFRACVGQCQRTGCVGKRCFTHCNFSSDGSSLDGPWYMQEPLYLRWKQWDCLSDCQYHCMLDREIERASHNQGPAKYHGKWPVKRLYGLQVCKFMSYMPLETFFMKFCYIFVFFFNKTKNYLNGKKYKKKKDEEALRTPCCIAISLFFFQFTTFFFNLFFFLGLCF